MYRNGFIEVDKVAHGKDPKPIEYVENENGCYICISHAKDKGYPLLRRAKKHVYIMRYLYERKYGKLPPGLVIRHKCDTPACVNVDHLETGTIADNIKDRHSRGRDARNLGTTNGNSLLTEEQVIEILSNPKITASEFGRRFGVWKTTILQIRKRKTWQHIHPTVSA